MMYNMTKHVWAGMCGALHGELDGEAVGDPQRGGARWIRGAVMATEGRFGEILHAVS